MQILDGKIIANQIKEDLKDEVKKFGRSKPGLAAIMVGDNEASKMYMGLKEQACKEVGIKFIRKDLPANATQNRLLKLIERLNKDEKIHGILLQLPLPERYDADEIIQAIDPSKDVDGFHLKNRQLLKEGKPRVLPPTQAGILKLLAATGQDLQDKQAVVMGNSLAFVESLRILLERQGLEAQSIISHEGYKRYTEGADVLVVAVGLPKLIKAQDIKKGAIVLDAGFNRLEGRVYGDVDFDSVRHKASFISPVPGGVGPLTVAYLLKNVVTLASDKSYKS